MTTKKFLRHPPGLMTLFFTEMWERFGYYGMRALLVLYLVEGLQAPRSEGLKLYGIYTALVYLTPVLGGAIADRWLGPRRAVLLGGMLMTFGHFAMMFPQTLHLALTALIIGNGLFKPNVTVMVGSLYARNDPRRDAGYTIFYVGINLGAFLSPIVCGTLGELYGWDYGFAAAGLGMFTGLMIFVFQQHRVRPLAVHSQPDRLLRWKDAIWLVGVALLVILAAWGVVSHWKSIEIFWHGMSNLQRVVVLVTVVLLPFFWPGKGAQSKPQQAAEKLSRDDFHRILAIVILGLFVIMFWMGFEQGGGTMNLFAMEYTDRTVGDWEVPASYFQAFNPLFIFFLAPVFSVLFLALEQRHGRISEPAKMAIGMIVLGVGFLVLAIAQQRAVRYGMVSPLWLIFVYLLHTIGELFLSPIGMSMVSRLAPAKLAALLMGLWFSAVAVANYLAAVLESLLLDSGIPLYWFLVASSVGAGLLLLAVTPIIKRLMHE